MKLSFGRTSPIFIYKFFIFESHFKKNIQGYDFSLDPHPAQYHSHMGMIDLALGFPNTSAWARPEHLK